MEADDLRNGDYIVKPTEERVYLKADYLTAKKWDQSGFSIRTTDKNVYTVTSPDGVEPKKVVGDPTNLGLGSFVDVAQSRDSLWATDGEQLHEYEMKERKWNPGRNNATEERLKSLVSFDDTLLGKTVSGKLAEANFNGRSKN